MSIDGQSSGSEQRYDSGYTSDDIETILDDLIDGTTVARLGVGAGLIVSLALGLGGDVVALSPTYTVMLEEPRHTLDARLDAVCAFIEKGMSLIDALAVLPAELQRATGSG